MDKEQLRAAICAIVNSAMSSLLSSAVIAVIGRN